MIPPKVKNKKNPRLFLKKCLKKKHILTAILVFLIVSLATRYFLTRAATLSVGDTFDNPEKIAERTNITICGGQIRLAEETWTTLTECNCNSLEGWYWYTTNGREACWSKTLADSVSWNKGVGNDTDNPGSYTCATDSAALKDRMIAASDGEWYKIVSYVNEVEITSSHNGSAGYSVISALAIADCIDGTRDLCTGDGCLGGDVAEINASLSAWASATGTKSALPYCVAGDCSSSSTSDFRNACEQNSSHDYPLACYEGTFYINQKTCNDGDANYTWAAAVYSSTYSRLLGLSSCSNVDYGSTSRTNSFDGFRAVVRP